jgi:hypothetical protein
MTTGKFQVSTMLSSGPKAKVTFLTQPVFKVLFLNIQVPFEKCNY